MVDKFNHIKITTASQDNGIGEPLSNVRYPSKDLAKGFAEQDANEIITAFKEFAKISRLPLSISEGDIKAAYGDDYSREKQSVLKIDLGEGPRILPVNDITSGKITQAVKSITFQAATTPVEAPVHAVKDEMNKITYGMLDSLSKELNKIAEEYPTKEAPQQSLQLASPKPARHR